MNLIEKRAMFDEFFNRFLRVLGGETLLSKKFSAENDEKELESFNLILDRKLSALENNYGLRSFSFRDRNSTTVLHSYILEFHPDEDVYGNPVIVLNDFPPFIKGDKQNPVLNMVLNYEDFEMRDEDLRLLTLCKK